MLLLVLLVLALLALLLALLLLLILLALLLLSGARAALDLVGLILADVEIPDLVLILLVHLSSPSFVVGRRACHHRHRGRGLSREYPGLLRLDYAP